MKPGFVRVTEMLGGYSVDGVAYGPFQPTPARPFLEVPESLANVLNLPRYEGPDTGDTADGQVPDEAMRQVLRERAAAVALAESFQRRLDEDTAEWEKQRASLLNDTAAALAREDAAKAELGDPLALVRRLEALVPGLSAELRERLAGPLGALSLALDDTRSARAAAGSSSAPQPQADAPASQGTPLPADIAHRDLLAANGFGTLEKLEAGLVLPEGAQESPVRALDGVGQKTEDSYRAVVADWRAQA